MFNKLQNVNIDCVFKWIILCVGFTSDNAGCAYLKAENTNNNNNNNGALYERRIHGEGIWGFNVWLFRLKMKAVLRH